MEPTQPQRDDVPTAPWLAPPPSEPLLPAAEKRSRGRRWALPVALAVGGVLLGGAAGAGIMAGVSDPTASEEYAALEQDLSRAEEMVEARERRNDELVAEMDEALEDAQEETSRARASQLLVEQRERDVAAREEAVTVTEDQIAARSVGQGVWTVGVDIEPGTYRTESPVSSTCYWAILRSGSNGDIVDNDIVTGGFPTVTLSVGQDFENTRCGTFVKQ